MGRRRRRPRASHSHIRLILGQTHYWLTATFRTPRAVVFSLIFPALLLVLFSSIFVAGDDTAKLSGGEQVTAKAYFTAGMLAYAITLSSFVLGTATMCVLGIGLTAAVDSAEAASSIGPLRGHPLLHLRDLRPGRPAPGLARGARARLPPLPLGRRTRARARPRRRHWARGRQRRRPGGLGPGRRGSGAALLPVGAADSACPDRGTPLGASLPGPAVRVAFRHSDSYGPVF